MGLQMKDVALSHWHSLPQPVGLHESSLASLNPMYICTEAIYYNLLQ